MQSRSHKLEMVNLCGSLALGFDSDATANNPGLHCRSFSWRSREFTRNWNSWKLGWLDSTRIQSNTLVMMTSCPVICSLCPYVICLFAGRRIFTDAWVCATAGNDSAKSDQRAEQSRSQQSRTSLNQTKDNKSIVRVPAHLLSLAANKRTSQDVDDAISHVCRRSSNFLFKLFKFSQS